MILDIKLAEDKPEKLVIYEGDNAEQVVNSFCYKNSKSHSSNSGIEIEEAKRVRLLEVIKAQIAEYYETSDSGVEPASLTAIEEEGSTSNI